MTSTKQFVCCYSKKSAYNRCEERDAAGTTSKQFFGDGQINAATKYFYSKDHLGSLREISDNSGVVQTEYSFDSFGRQQVIKEAVAADYGYADYYYHRRSGLNLTGYRDYSSIFGRWLTRDPIEEGHGLNLFAYVENSPIIKIDPLGLRGWSMGLFGWEYHDSGTCYCGDLGGGGSSAGPSYYSQGHPIVIVRDSDASSAAGSGSDDEDCCGKAGSNRDHLEKTKQYCTKPWQRGKGFTFNLSY